MTLLPALSWVLDTTAPQARDPEAASTLSSLAVAALILLSWTLGETIHSPALAEHFVVIFLFNGLAVLVVVGWYFRVGRLCGGSWASYATGLATFTWVLSPGLLLLPVALLTQPIGMAGLVAYEVVKAVIALSFISRTTEALHRLNQWPPWAAFLLALSPLFVAVAGAVLLFLGFAFGGLLILLMAAGH